MSKISDITAAQRGRYRAEFAGQDLGFLSAPPEISAGYETAAFAVCNETGISGYDEVENSPRLYGTVKLHCGAVADALQMIFQNRRQTAELKLAPEFPGTGVTLRFPAAQLLPKWEFAPHRIGDHCIVIYLRLRADSAGNLFYPA